MGKPSIHEGLTALLAALGGTAIPRRIPTGPDSWLSTSELADLTGKDPATIRRWVTRDSLPAKQLHSGRYLIRYGDFLDWSGAIESKRSVRHGARAVLRAVRRERS